MKLRKLRFSHPEVLQAIPEPLRDSQVTPLTLRDSTQCGSTLGICWNTQADSFHIVILQLEDCTPTKRNIVSSVAQVYDIMGWFSLLTFQVKVLLQRLWSLKVDWDTPVPETLLLTWEKWKSSLPKLQHHFIPREYFNNQSPVVSTTLHAFSEASTKGYGGVIYIRLFHQDTSVKVSLVTSKTILATLRTLTITRLELSAAPLTAKLLYTVAQDLGLPQQAGQISWSH